MASYILWDSQTEAAPFNAGGQDGVIAISQEIANTNEDNSMDITLEIEDLVPEAETSTVGYEVDLYLEEEVAAGVWVPVASIDKQGLNGLNDPLNQVLQYGPMVLLNEGEVINIRAGGKVVTNISRHSGVLGEKVRIKLVCVVLDDTKPLLQSITFSAQARRYNR